MRRLPMLLVGSVLLWGCDSINPLVAPDDALLSKANKPYVAIPISLPPGPFEDLRARYINDPGQVVGTMRSLQESGLHTSQAFLWSARTGTVALEDPEVDVFVGGLNNAGEVLLWRQTSPLSGTNGHIVVIQYEDGELRRQNRRCMVPYHASGISDDGLVAVTSDIDTWRFRMPDGSWEGFLGRLSFRDQPGCEVLMDESHYAISAGDANRRGEITGFAVPYRITTEFFPEGMEKYVRSGLPQPYVWTYERGFEFDRTPDSRNNQRTRISRGDYVEGTPFLYSQKPARYGVHPHGN